MTVFRIGSGAGYSGDRIDPARDLAERGQLDALVFECLAERTISLAQLRRSADPDAGFDPLLEARMRAVLPACVAQGVTIITNMGAANPLAAGKAVLDVARELGLSRLRVAVVTGDDVLPWMLANDVPLMDSDQSVRSLDGRLISANAYLGASGIVSALAQGADVVVTGRVCDPALFLAPLFILASPGGRSNQRWRFLAAVSLLAAGSLYRINAYLMAVDPGNGWVYFPSAPELMITVGVVCLEFMLYLFFIKTLPILHGSANQSHGRLS